MPDNQPTDWRLPVWALQTGMREVFENTVAVGGSHAFGVLMGCDAYLIANGQEPTTFTRRGVMTWMETINHAR